MKGLILLISLLFLSVAAFAQTDKKEVREGNKLYKQEQFSEAGVAYLRALTVDSTSLAARFNLGDALYKQNQYEQSENIFKSLASPELLMNLDNKAKVFHNLGNATLKQKKWQESVDAYKQSLRLNPSDDETRTNLAYAQEMLEKDQQQQQQNQDNQNKDNQNKDNENKDDKNKDDQNKDDNQDKNNQQQQPQGQEPKISPQQAQQMLEAIQADEKNTQEKVKKEKAKAAGRYKTEKNW